MKFIVLLFSILFSLNVFSETQAVITPERPGHCEDQNSAVNKITDIAVKEDASTLKIHFRTSVIHCSEGILQQLPLQDFSVKIIGNKYYSFFHTYPVKAEIKETSSEGSVTLTFNKKVIFKNTTTAGFLYTFVSLWEGYEYRWNLVLTKIDENNTFLQFSKPRT
ncbi:MAG: hypothetical protein ACXVCY_11800 [Pseudobdellovibrionaceae bacterium]